VETARQYLTQLIIDVVSWSEQDMGPADGAESRREHAIAFVRNALLPGATASIRKIARNVALPISHEVADGRSSPNARRDQILVDTVELVCKRHNLQPTRRSGRAESGCSIVATALPKFFTWLRMYSDEQLRKLAELREPPESLEEIRKFVTELRKLPKKLFPEGALSEQRIENIWIARTRS